MKREQEHVDKMKINYEKITDCNMIRTSVSYLVLFFQLFIKSVAKLPRLQIGKIFWMCAGSLTLVKQKNPALSFSRRMGLFLAKDSCKICCFM